MTIQGMDLWTYDLKSGNTRRPNATTFTTACLVNDHLGFATITAIDRKKEAAEVTIHDIYNVTDLTRAVQVMTAASISLSPEPLLFLPDPLTNLTKKYSVTHGSARCQNTRPEVIADYLQNPPPNYTQWLDEQDEDKGGLKYFLNPNPEPWQTDGFDFETWQRKNPKKRIYYPPKHVPLTMYVEPPYPSETVLGHPSDTALTAGKYAYIMALLLLHWGGHLQAKPEISDRVFKAELFREAMKK
jgi:hypothetical protein